jgi:putative transposase
MPVNSVKKRQFGQQTLRRIMATRKASKVPADILDVPEKAWADALRREKFIRPLLDVSQGLFKAVAVAARGMKVDPRTVSRWLKRYRREPSLLSLIERPRGAPIGHHRLSAQQEDIMRRVIIEQWRSRPRPTVVALFTEVLRVCRLEGVPPVSKRTVATRIERMYDPSLAQSGLIDPKKRATPGTFRVQRALEVVQIDHTPVDIIIVDELYRKPIGRPWITVALDVCTRAVMGFWISLDAPSSISVSLCLSHACLPKDVWLRERNLDLSWPMCGLPEKLHMDNGSEFHAEALRRGAERYGIKLVYRPVARPHYGGHIERLLGTLMHRIHALPGQTGSNPQARGDYPSGAKAVCTLSDLEQWLAIEICDKYHRSIHGTLNRTPASAWAMAREGQPSREVNHPDQFAIEFMPAVRRRVRHDGIKLFNIRYWDSLLQPHVGTGEAVLLRYNPRDLSRIFVPSARLSRYIEVRYADLRHPPISLWEHRGARAQIREDERKVINEATLFRAIAKQRKIIRDASVKTTRARRAQERLRATSQARQETTRKGQTRQTHPTAGIAQEVADYSREVVPSSGEQWE